MSDKDAMILAIVASPDDPGPRKILADWLEEYEPPENDLPGHDRSCLRRSGHWLLVRQEYNLPQDLVWMAADGEGITGAGVMNLGPVPGGPLRCLYQPDMPVTHITGETVTYKGAVCGAVAIHSHDGKWLCWGHFQEAADPKRKLPKPAPKPKPVPTVTPAQEALPLAWLRWRNVTFLEALNHASDKEGREVPWPEPILNIARGSTRATLIALNDDTYVAHVDGQFWIGDEEESRDDWE